MNGEPPFQVVFFKTETGREPVRDWLLKLDKEDRKVIGEDIKVVQFRWPLGMPLVRKLEADMWEVRSQLPGGRIARVFFTTKSTTIVLLHALMKKSTKTPKSDLELARERKTLWLSKQKEL
jgi:phage-related protein